MVSERELAILEKEFYLIWATNKRKNCIDELLFMNCNFPAFLISQN